MKRLYVVALALVLAGCGGDPPPAAPPAPTHSASGSAAATPVMPVKAKEDSKEGAEAFVRYYVEVLNLAQQTGRLSKLRHLATRKCTSCARVSNAIEEIYSAGGHINGGDLKLDIQMVYPRQTFDGWLAFGTIKYGPSKISTPGQPVRALKSGTGPVTFNVVYRNGHPLLAEWTRES